MNKLTFKLAFNSEPIPSSRVWSDPSTRICVALGGDNLGFRAHFYPHPFWGKNPLRRKSLIDIARVDDPIYTRSDSMIMSPTGFLEFPLPLARWENGCIGGRSMRLPSWNESKAL